MISLHHVTPLAESCRRLGSSSPPVGRLVIDEFDVERFDRRAASWWFDRGDAHSQAHDGDPTGVADLRAHLHGVGRLRGELEQWFTLSEPVRGPYMYRWDLPPGMRAERAADRRRQPPGYGRAAGRGSAAVSPGASRAGASQAVRASGR